MRMPGRSAEQSRITAPVCRPLIKNNQAYFVCHQAAGGIRLFAFLSPAEGYILDTVTVVGDSGTEYEFDYYDNSFRMPEENVTIHVTFKEWSDIDNQLTFVIICNGEKIADGATVSDGDTL